jgi:hypothetical protein
MNQQLSNALRTLLKTAMIEMERCIKDSTTDSLKVEWAKKETCWKKVCDQPVIDISVLHADLIDATSQPRQKQSEEALEEEANVQALQKIKAVPPSVWIDIKDWGAIKKTLTGQQAELIVNIHKKMKMLLPFSAAEIKGGAEILDKVWALRPDLLENIEDMEQQFVKQPDISLETVQKIVDWDKENQKLSALEHELMEKMANGTAILSDAYKKVALLNLKKVQGFGFTE